MGFRLSPVVAVAVSIATSSAGYTADFAIETEVFRDDSPKPQARHVTIFSEGRIYDFSIMPAGHITVLDRQSQRFALADTRHQVQASLSTDNLVRFVAIEQAAAERSEVELIRFAAFPEFDTTYDEKTGELRMTSDFWDYHVQTQRVEDAAQRQFNLFADWFTQLNALFSPIPPGLRMELNQELSKRNRLPVRVVASIKQDGRVKVRQESRHRLIPQLGQRERQMLDQWQEAQAIYRFVPFAEYRSAQLPPKQKRSSPE